MALVFCIRFAKAENGTYLSDRELELFPDVPDAGGMERVRGS
jgi:hypothetical protein